MTDLIAELAEVVSIVESLTMSHHTCDDAWFSCPKSGECGDEYAGDECNCGADAHNSKVSAVAERINATLTRILTDDAAIRAAHHDLVIRLGEVTTQLEAANALLRNESALLRAWARESREGGWSTHQVDPMKRRADEIDAHLSEPRT